MTKLRVNQGNRVAASLPDFDGEAGFVDHGEGRAALSYEPNRRGFVRSGSSVEISGKSWIVESAVGSSYLKGFRVLELRAAE